MDRNICCSLPSFLPSYCIPSMSQLYPYRKLPLSPKLFSIMSSCAGFQKVKTLAPSPSPLVGLVSRMQGIWESRWCLRTTFHANHSYSGLPCLPRWLWDSRLARKKPRQLVRIRLQARFRKKGALKKLGPTKASIKPGMAAEDN